jgi:hypothetical protein
LKEPTQYPHSANVSHHLINKNKSEGSRKKPIIDESRSANLSESQSRMKKKSKKGEAPNEGRRVNNPFHLLDRSSQKWRDTKTKRENREKKMLREHIFSAILQPSHTGPNPLPHERIWDTTTTNRIDRPIPTDAHDDSSRQKRKKGSLPISTVKCHNAGTVTEERTGSRGHEQEGGESVKAMKASSIIS